MNKTAVLTIVVVIGFIVLAIIGVGVLAFFPYEQFFAPTPTITSTPTVTATPTFPVFLPTARSDTPTKPPPSPTNTLVPTFTPAPTGTPTPTFAAVQPTFFVKTPPPVDEGTPESPPADADSDSETTPEPTPTQGSRLYTLTFEADKTTVEAGRCTTLRWQSTGPVNLWYEGQAVGASGQERVCPRVTTTYILEYQVGGTAGREMEQVTVTVE